MAATAMAGACSLLVLLAVALAGGASTAAAAFSGGDSTVNVNNDGVAAPALLTPKPPSPGDVNAGIMGCLMGCFTQVFSCALGCMGKGPDLPLCIVSCDQKSVVCMIRCALSPSPSPSPPGPKPSPPGPKPPGPKPPAPKPPTPAPPGPPPHAATGRKTATSA